MNILRYRALCIMEKAIDIKKSGYSRKNFRIFVFLDRKKKKIFSGYILLQIWDLKKFRAIFYGEYTEVKETLNIFLVISKTRVGYIGINK